MPDLCMLRYHREIQCPCANYPDKRSTTAHVLTQQVQLTDIFQTRSQLYANLLFSHVHAMDDGSGVQVPRSPSPAKTPSSPEPIVDGEKRNSVVSVGDSPYEDDRRPSMLSHGSYSRAMSRAIRPATKIFIVFYSMYGHVYQMAEAVAEGARLAHNCEVTLLQVAETLPDSVLEKTGAKRTRASFKGVPIVKPEQLVNADAVIFGSPTRFGDTTAQMRHFLDQLHPLWQRNALAGKVASVFTATSTQHGGLETTVLSFMATAVHHGMIFVPGPAGDARVRGTTEITGCGPFGAGTISGPDGRRHPTVEELAVARAQGKYVAEVARAVQRSRAYQQPLSA